MTIVEIINLFLAYYWESFLFIVELSVGLVSVLALALTLGTGAKLMQSEQNVPSSEFA
jgi:hypothetical protein